MSYALSARERITDVIKTLHSSLKETDSRELRQLVRRLDNEWEAYQADRLEPLTVHTGARPPDYARDLEPPEGWWWYDREYGSVAAEASES